MGAELTVVKLPEQSVADIPRGLRAIAEAIERGEYGDAYHLGKAMRKLEAI